MISQNQNASFLECKYTINGTILSILLIFYNVFETLLKWKYILTSSDKPSEALFIL